MGGDAFIPAGVYCQTFKAKGSILHQLPSKKPEAVGPWLFHTLLNKKPDQQM